jgi:hypothetical protein
MASRTSLRGVLAGARDEKVLGALGEFDGDVADVFGRLAEAEDDFGHALADGAVVIDLGEAQVLKRHVFEAVHGVVDIDAAGAHLLQ